MTLCIATIESASLWMDCAICCVDDKIVLLTVAIELHEISSPFVSASNVCIKS